MLAEHPTPQPTEPVVRDALGDAINAPMDVVVLVVPDREGLSDEFVAAISEVRDRGDAAVLVVFPRVVGADVLQRAEAAGASHCAVAPSSDDLFTHIERARTLRRQAIVEDDPLDVFWRNRSRR